MQRLVRETGWVRMVAVGDPPYRYRVTFLCKGLERDGVTGAVRVRQQHVADLYLTADYPRVTPQVVWRTPIFHPNFRFRDGRGEVCVAGWEPAQTLAAFVIRLGRMVQYQHYETRYPLDWEAARWAQEHERQLPVDRK